MHISVQPSLPHKRATLNVVLGVHSSYSLLLLLLLRGMSINCSTVCSIVANQPPSCLGQYANGQL